MNLGAIIKAASITVGKYAPQILTALGIAGMTSAVIFAAQAAPVARDTIKEEEFKRKENNNEGLIEKKGELTLKTTDKIKLTWKYYAPAGVMVILSAACIIGGQYILHKRLVAMTAAYTAVAEAANQYQDKVKEMLSKSQVEKIDEAVAQEKVDDIPDAKFDEAESIDGGTDLFVDALSGRVFKARLENIKKGLNEFNYQLLNEMFCTVNDLYNWWGLERTVLGECVGWNIDKGMADFKYDTVMKNGHPVCVIRPINYPEARRSTI